MNMNLNSSSHVRGSYWRWVFNAAPVFGVIVGLAMLSAAPQPPTTSSQPAAITRDDSAAEKLGWRLGTQSWTFRDRTLFEVIDIAHVLGLKYMECYPGQPFSKGHPDVKFDVDLKPELQKELKAKFETSGVKMVSMGVVGFKNDEAECRKTFDFAKAMGLEAICCEPDEDAFDVLEKLCEEYKINLAIHDHPKPSHYWNPETVLKVAKGRSQRIGACADTGHWSRSGLVPVECLKTLEGRIIESHFKDIANDKDQPWGTGQGNARGMLEELKRQNFHGVILLEYETGSGKELEDNAAKCIAFFDATARELAKEPMN